MISALMLYGSCARKDNTADSDVDMLAIGDQEHFAKAVNNKVNVSVYSKDIFKAMASESSLFSLHLKLEGVVLIDHSGGWLRDTLDSVRIRSDYGREIATAYEVGREVVERYRSDYVDYGFLNKRIAWVVRTLLVVHSIKLGSPTFSADGLSKCWKESDIGPLISVKSRTKKAVTVLKRFESFIDSFESLYPPEGSFPGVSKAVSELMKKPRSGGGY